MKKKLLGITFIVLFICFLFSACALVDVYSSEEQSYSIVTYQNPFSLDRHKKDVESEVYLGGMPIGISVNTEGVIVLEKSPVITAGGTVSPLENADLRRGDIIKAVNGNTVTNVAEMGNYIEAGENKLSILRGVDSFLVTALSAKDVMSNRYRLGLTVKDGLNGIGTLTFVTKDMHYGALGHRISDQESGLSFEFSHGEIFKSEIIGSVRGERGAPGELTGTLYSNVPFGVVEKNTPFGIYGMWNSNYKGELINTMSVSKIKTGEAEIYTTIFGTQPKRYKINILKLAAQNSQAERSMIIEVTDPELLNKTGGIVQGMSGSPIIQDGKLIGAVTHVFTGDPTKGYGVYIPWMLENASATSDAAWCNGAV